MVCVLGLTRIDHFLPLATEAGTEGASRDISSVLDFNSFSFVIIHDIPVFLLHVQIVSFTLLVAFNPLGYLPVISKSMPCFVLNEALALTQFLKNLVSGWQSLL